MPVHVRDLHVGKVAERPGPPEELSRCTLHVRRGLDLEQALAGVAALRFADERLGCLDEHAADVWVEDASRARLRLRRSPLAGLRAG